MSRALRAVAPLAAVALASVGLTFAGDAGWKKEKEIVLPGGGGFDYVNADAALRRLFVAHSSKIDVIDLDKGERVGEVPGVDGAHGCIAVPEVERGFATAGKKAKLVVFELASLKVVKEVETGEGPDALLHVATTGEVWTLNHRAGTITCVDAKSLAVTKTIEVAGALEAAVEWREKGLVFVNAEDESFLAAIDAKKHEVLAKYPLAPGEEPAGLALDEKDGLLFAGCGNAKLVVLDAATGKAVASLPIGKHCDSCAFDPETRNAFASCGDGTTSVVHVKDAKTFEALEPITTEKGGRTCSVDAKTHKLYVATGPRRNEKGDVKVLVFAP